MPPERKRPDIKKELSAPSEELSVLEQLEELWSDVVQEDSDVFIPSARKRAIFGCSSAWRGREPRRDLAAPLRKWTRISARLFGRGTAFVTGSKESG